MVCSITGVSSNQRVLNSPNRLAGILHHDKRTRRLEQSRIDCHCDGESKACPQESPMTQTSNRFFDEMARLVNDATGAAQGFKREIDTVFKHQAEKFLNDMDLVKREEFEAVKEMARIAREENDALKARITVLEAKLGGSTAS
jgi:BMFP domain-containing protein YqiC